MAQSVPLPRPRPVLPPAWIEPLSFREAAGPDFDISKVTAETTDCGARLAKVAVVEPMPRLIGPGACGGEDMVRLDAVNVGAKRVELKPAPYLRCPMAEQLVTWVRDEAVPRAAALGAPLQVVDTFDDFDCRGRNRQVNGRLSEHGKGNAVDIRSFTLADGRVFTLTDLMAPKEVREQLRQSACGRFSTVLGPGSDGHHEQHIHLDYIERRNGYRVCQWAILEPPPPQPTVAVVLVDGEETGETVPLPQPRPAVAAAKGPFRRL